MFNSFFGYKAEVKNHVSLETDDEELQQRVESLSDDETQIYGWLRQYYSERWIAETLFIDRFQFKRLMKSLCFKLGVSGVKSMLRIYSRLYIKYPKQLICTGEFDDYVEARTEKEIQLKLKQETSRDA